MANTLTRMVVALIVVLSSLLVIYNYKYIHPYSSDKLDTAKQDSESIAIENDDTIKTVELYFLDSIYSLNSIYFKFNSAELSKELYPELDTLANYLNNNSNYRIEIMGHTDTIGDKNYNLLLSKQRAKTIADYLIDKEIINKRIEYDGKGEGKLGRKVEFIIRKEIIMEE